ncbi:MAG: peptidoglycan glycosyltransferase [Clostridia bacterium]|nr:peptidoglycan glycosyltransferase [Clostridia bacterium]
MNDKKITWVLLAISGLFLTLIIYLTSVVLLYGDEYSSSELNARALIREERIMRGTIYDSGGEVLAYSEMDGDVQKRYYPHGKLYSHLIGYSSKNYGKSFIEKEYNSFLVGSDELNKIFNIDNAIAGQMNDGYDLHLTVNHATQEKASKLMEGYRGALVAINPQTGEIIAMVSKPDFDPHEDYLNANWDTLGEDESAPFLNRATMGLYPPGSTFKTVTTAVMHMNGMQDYSFDDETGRIDIGGHTISNTRDAIHGETDITKAFTRSSNVYFAKAGSEIPAASFADMASKLMFNSSFGGDFPHMQSRFYAEGMTDAEQAITAIGQGKTLTSPLHLAMITGAIANGGTMMKPYIVSSVMTNGGTVIKTNSPEVLSNAIPPETAQFVKDLMVDTVEYGTGTNAKISGITVGGKTGTAENELTVDDPEKTHALFIAFAPAENPQIAVAVVLEYAGSTGGTIAAPIARDVIKTYLGK